MKSATLGATLFVLVGSLMGAGYYLAVNTTAAQGADEKYPYRGETFTSFVDDSFQKAGQGKADDFYSWFESAYQSGSFHYPGQEGLSLPELLDWKRKQLDGITDPAARTKELIDTGAWVHRMVKKTIPKFSLDRGFEFRYTVQNGERQCFLQSVLISGLLQSMGADAGVAMVYKNIQGQECNNGHAVCVLKLPDGRDIVVDASEPEPFPKHQGLFLSVPGNGYRFLDPRYEADPPTISAYRASDGKSIEPRRLRTLDTRFLQSQFDYYRGERAVGGLLDKNITPQGVATEAKFLKLSVDECPENPLAVFMLGRTYRRQGDAKQAQATFENAFKLYSRQGYVPGALRAMMAPASSSTHMRRHLHRR